jgi:hypothetical protein
VNAMPAGEEAARDRSQAQEWGREKEKHPFYYHYEIETIHSDLIHVQQWILGSVEDTEEDEQGAGPPIWKNVTRWRILFRGRHTRCNYHLFISSAGAKFIPDLYTMILRSLRELRRTRVVWLTLCVIFR